MACHTTSPCWHLSIFNCFYYELIFIGQAGHPWCRVLFLHENRFWEMLHHITSSPVDHLQWMGADPFPFYQSKQLIKYIAIIHATPVHQSMSYVMNSCFLFFSCKKQINDLDIFTSNSCFLPKYKSINHNNAYSCVLYIYIYIFFFYYIYIFFSFIISNIMYFFLFINIL